MNIIKAENTKTMLSVEIAKMVNRRHDNVMRDIRKILAEANIVGLLKFEETYVDGQNGKSYPCFRLPKDLTLLVIGKYSTQARLAIIQKLSEVATPKVEALPAPDQKVEALEHRVKELENSLVTAIRENIKTSTHNLHTILMGWVDDGICTHTTHDRTYHIYQVTEYGKSLGYTTNKNGTVIPPTNIS